jgi:Cytochrome c554 and c-prime
VNHRVVGCVVLVALGAVWAATMPQQAAVEAAIVPDVPVNFKTSYCWQGAGSCASASCHGGDGPKGCKGSEFSTFMSCDPHLRAYRVLFEDRSKRIVEILNGGPCPPAHENALCLACHGTNPPHELRGKAFTMADGVSCENCHGAAGNWLTTHYEAGWKHLSPAQKAAQGFRPTKDLVVRAKLCVECHVGQGDAEVNHDLIAAGHPRLNFEYSSFLAVYPKHWNAHEEKAAYPDLEARTWALGQMLSANAALELLAHRAGSKGNVEGVGGKAWPEFSEYDCFACHQGLREQVRGPRPGRAPGTIPWGTWYYPLVKESLTALPVHGDFGMFPALAAEMKKPQPNRELVARLARDTAANLDSAAFSLAVTKGNKLTHPRQLLTRLAHGEQAKLDGSWDEATQLYLALAALYHASTDLDDHARDPLIRISLAEMAKQLAFPLGTDSPGKLDLKTMREQLNVIQQRLGH